MGYFQPPPTTDYEGGIIVDSGYIYKLVKNNNRNYLDVIPINFPLNPP